MKTIRNATAVCALVCSALFGQASAEDQKMIVLDSSSETPVIHETTDTAVVVFTMGTGQEPREDKTAAHTACGEREAVLRKYYQVATASGGDHGSRTYVAICAKLPPA